jgi:hypothetical protein
MARRKIMITRRIVTLVVFAVTVACGSSFIQAQQPQIPTLQVCNSTEVHGDGQVKISRRSDVNHSGSFSVKLNLKCGPDDSPYPEGTLDIYGIDMSDSILGGQLTATSIDQITSTGKHTPMVFLNGRCTKAGIKGCRFWMMITDNRFSTTSTSGTPDIVSFLVFDMTGKRVAHGTGSVVSGAFTVRDTGN